MSTQISNPEDYIPSDEYNPHRVRPWLIGSDIGILAIAYADCPGDAMDAAADAEHLKALALDENEEMELYEEYGENAPIDRFGNYGRPFDSINSWIEELPNMSPDDLMELSDQKLYDLYLDYRAPYRYA